MDITLSGPPDNSFSSRISITGSKSETNRLLLLKALYPGLDIENSSNSDDARVMREGILRTEGEVDVHHAGTAMRFLTAFFACQPDREVRLTGSKRMTERPVGILVDALRSLGADISYMRKAGYPPLHIRGKSLRGKKVSLPANISSQYISALLLIAPRLEHGLDLELQGSITSVPYIRMTLGLLDQLGIENTFIGDRITVRPRKEIEPKRIVVESDWSAASYYYSILALAEPGSEIELASYRKNSLQGDSVLEDIYRDFGIDTKFADGRILLSKGQPTTGTTLRYDLANAPDIAQTIAVTCFGLGMGCELTGLHTLKIKETDRLEALRTELTKLGAQISVTERSLSLKAGETLRAGVAIDTYDDHRMAMAFAPLALKTTISIKDASVVAKSYPDFWRDLEGLQFSLKR